MKILLAGIGNIFMGDDGFGCEVVSRLAQQRLPDGVDLVDFGIRGLDLYYALRDDYELVILIDIAHRGGTAGSLYVIEPELPSAKSAIDGTPQHDLAPDRMLQMAAALGADCPRLLLIACEPAYLGGDEGFMGLSKAVAAAVEPAAEQVLRQLSLFRQRAAIEVGATEDCGGEL